MGRPIQSNADLRAERHARTFAGQQITLDPHVIRLARDGYNAQQIAMLSRVPLVDVRLMLAAAERAARPASVTGSHPKPKRQRAGDPNA